MKKTILILSVVLCAVALLLGKGSPVMAGDVSSVIIDAPTEVVEDSDFTVSVDIDDVTAFDAGQFDVSFDESLVRLDNVTAGQIGATQIPVDLWNRMSTGTYRIIVNVPGVPGVSGSGSLAVLQFHAASSAVGSSALSLSNGFLNDNLATQISATWTGAAISVRDNLGITAPRVTTGGVTNLATTSATLNGNLATLGTASSVQVSFEWGLTTSYGNTTAPQTMTATGTFSADLTGLTANTTYHFSAKAVRDGPAYSDDHTFTTLVSAAAPSVDASDATKDNPSSPSATVERPVFRWWVLSVIVGAAVVLIAAVVAGVLFRRRQMVRALQASVNLEPKMRNKWRT